MDKEAKKKIIAQKKWVKTLRFWKKINERIRIIEDDSGQFIVQVREFLPFRNKYTEWEDIHQFSTYKHALKRKHSYIVMILMRDMGCRNDFVRKRTERKKQLGLV